MADQPLTIDAWLEDADEISDSGERVSHLVKDFTFYAHLSIYDFAAQFCRDAVVLDAGCGAGYGAAHLAQAGARQVNAVDVSEKAVAFSRHHFPEPQLEFEVGDLEHLTFAPGTFDFVYTSNTLEHLADVAAFLRSAHTSLKPGGAMLVAVPPITDDRLTYINVINRYHLNIWSPRQWEFVLRQFFGQVDVFLHELSPIAAAYESGVADPGTPLGERDFLFTPGTVEEMYRRYTLTAILVARTPRAHDELPPAGSAVEFVDESFSRAPGHVDPELRLRLKPYFDAAVLSSPRPSEPSPGPGDPSPHLLRRAWAVWRTDGARVFLRKTVESLKRRL